MDVFDQIAPAWYNFRHWSIFARELEMLAKRWQQGKLVNLGCGHGPDFLPFTQGFELYGVDSSVEMLKLARKYARKFKFKVELVAADVTNLPYRDNTFDWAISVATYHHIRYPEARQRALNELERVLKPGGEAFITVWNRWQPRFWFKSKEVSVPWRQQDKTLYRYYYLFTSAELEKLARQAGLKVIEFFPESSHRSRPRPFSRNICLLLGKSQFAP